MVSVATATYTQYSSQKTEPADILAVINPNSGSKKALKLFKEIVEPVWNEKRVSYEVLETRHAGHCLEELSNDQNISRFKKIVAVGGDGTLVEVINGLKNNLFVKDAEKSISLGIIPVGSGNGLATSLHALNALDKNECPVRKAAIMTASAATRSLDLLEVTQDHKKTLSTLSVTFGLIANIDIKSEMMRCIGSLRYKIAAIISILFNKTYFARVKYLPDFQDLPEGSISNDSLNMIQGDFTLFMASNTSHCSSDAIMAPEAKPDDGFIHLTVIDKKISKCALLRMLLNLGDEKWTEASYVRKIKTKYFVIENLDEKAILTVDGEVVPTRDLECRIHQRALKVLCG